MFLCGSSGDVRRENTLAILEFAVLAGVQYILYAAKEAAPNYYVGTLRADHVGSCMLFRLPTSLGSTIHQRSRQPKGHPVKSKVTKNTILSHFGYYRVADKIRMDLVLLALAFYRVSKHGWCSPSGSDDFLSYDFASDTLQGYQAEEIAPVERQKVNDDPVLPESATAVDVDWLPVWCVRRFLKLDVITCDTCC